MIQLFVFIGIAAVFQPEAVIVESMELPSPLFLMMFFSVTDERMMLVNPQIVKLNLARRLGLRKLDLYYNQSRG